MTFHDRHYVKRAV